MSKSMMLLFCGLLVCVSLIQARSVISSGDFSGSGESSGDESYSGEGSSDSYPAIKNSSSDEKTSQRPTQISNHIQVEKDDRNKSNNNEDKDAENFINSDDMIA